MSRNQNVGTWLDAPLLILVCFVTFINSLFDSLLSSNLFNIISLHPKYSKVCSSFCGFSSELLIKLEGDASSTLKSARAYFVGFFVFSLNLKIVLLACTFSLPRKSISLPFWVGHRSNRIPFFYVNSCYYYFH